VWRSEADVAAHWRTGRAFDPSLSIDEAAARMARWRETVSRTRG
jgi:glycerol kinase